MKRKKNDEDDDDDDDEDEGEDNASEELVGGKLENASRVSFDAGLPNEAFLLLCADRISRNDGSVSDDSSLCTLYRDVFKRCCARPQIPVFELAGDFTRSLRLKLLLEKFTWRFKRVLKRFDASKRGGC